jgi:hypothetical protein
MYTICLKTNPEFPLTQIWRVLVGIVATLLDMLDGSIKAKPSLKHGAFVRVRRALRSVCLVNIAFLYTLMQSQAGDKLPFLITTLLSQSKSSPMPIRFFPLLGVAVSVLLRLKHVEVARHARLSEDLKVCSSAVIHAHMLTKPKNGIVNAYSSNVIMTKTAIPTHVQVWHTRY